MTSRFNQQFSGLRGEAEKESKFKRIHMNKIVPARPSQQSNKSVSPEKVRSDKVRSEKANNSSLYDVSIKNGSVLDKLGTHKQYGWDSPATRSTGSARTS